MVLRPCLLATLLASLACGLVPASAQAAKDFVGVASEDVYLNTDPGYRGRTLAAQQKAGVQLIRQQITWEQVEIAPGVYDFDAVDEYVAALARRGVRLLPTLSDAPAFYERPTSVRGFPPPTDMRKMADFAVALVRRYGPSGTLWSERPLLRRVPIRAWQIWNEPPLPVYWPPTPSASEYSRMLRVVGAAIRAEDPDAEIVTAAIPNSLLTGAVNYKKFIAGIYRGAGRRAFDSLAINSYALDAKDLLRLLTSVRKLMNSRGDRNKKIWITEIGWADKGPFHRFVVGAKRQKKNTEEAFELIRKVRKKLKLRGVVYYSWRDVPRKPGRPDEWGLHTGLLTLSGTRKPVFKAFVAGAKKLR